MTPSILGWCFIKERSSWQFWIPPGKLVAAFKSGSGKSGQRLGAHPDHDGPTDRGERIVILEATSDVQRFSKLELPRACCLDSATYVG
jgi:hypothetical protein